MTATKQRGLPWGRIVALGLFWLAQMLVVIIAGFVVGSVGWAIGERRLDAWHFFSEADDYLWHLVSQNDGLLLLLSYALVATAVTLFVAPLVGPLRLSVTGRSLRSSVIGASILGGFVSFLFVGLLAELPLLYGAGKNLGWWTSHPLGLLSSWLVAGGVWAGLLWKAGSARDPMGLDRLLRLLFAATMLETALAVPIYLIARKKESCYCALHSWLSMLGGAAILCMLCGPWAMLFLTRTARRGWQRSACPRCGYPRRTDAAVCSECGSALPARVEQDPADGR